MNYTYKRCDFNFKRIGEPRTRSALKISISSRNWSRIKTHLILKSLLEHFASKANTTMSPLAFTLVNVTDILSGHSYGFCPNPIGVLKLGSDIAFTFAISPTADLDYSDAPPIYVRRVANDVVFWGYSNPKDFVTITVDTSQIITRGIALKDLEYLYNIIGGASKNFAVHKAALKGFTQPQSVDLGAKFNAVYNMHLAEMIFQVPFEDWVYNKQVWENCPEILMPEHINHFSALYFATFINDRTNAQNIFNEQERVSHLVDALYPYYSKSQSIIFQSKTGEDPKLKGEEEYITSLIFPAATYKIFQSLFVPGYPRLKFYQHSADILNWLEDKVQSKVYADISYLTDISMLYEVSGFAKDAIYCRQSSFKKVASILTDNIQNNSQYF